MTAEQIKKLIAEGESFTVEFKKNTNELNRDVFETVASFSNRYGGHIILGVEDNGVILGVNRNNAISIKKNFVNQLNNPNFIMPSLFLNLEEIELDGKILLYVYVPVASQLVLLGGKIYDRTEDADIDITRSVDLVANLVRRKSLEFTERRIFSYTTKADLRLAELMPKVRIMANTHIKNHPWTKMSDMEILRSAGLYEDDKTTGKQGFNLAGILLFGRDEIIQSCTPNYVTDAILRRVNLDRYDDRLRVETNLIDSFGLLIDFIAKHTLDKFFLIDNQSVSVRNAIAREIVSNSLVHREYTSTVPAQIIVEKDRIIAQNWCRATYQGKLDPSKFTPEPKNPLLAKFFVNIGYADQLGSGVRNLYKFTRIYSGCDPELIEGDIFKTIIPLTENCSASEEIQREVGRKSGESREKP
ncbi:MAG: putative DNA binding domain-containing protein [Clostridiales bacterium]|jgi:ATP-dependent DNA helicase RecG|nr:putative DNA binding domain-containing protein [Clostridiales bacterium]